MAGEVRYYTLEDAARILRLYPDRVREMLEDGEIEGTRTGDTGGWRIPLRGDPDVPPPPVEATTPPPPTEPTPRPAPEPPNEDRGSADEALEEARQPAKLPRGDDAKISGEISSEVTSESGWVTTQQAARALGISARTVRWQIERGNLDAKPEGEGVERT